MICQSLNPSYPLQKQSKIENLQISKTVSKSILKNPQSAKKNQPLHHQSKLYYGDVPLPKPIAEWNKSSATLRNSSVTHQFSSNQRFSESKSNYQDIQQLIYPSSLTKRSTFFGSSKRFGIHKVFQHGKGMATQLCPFYQVNSQQKLRSASSVCLQKGKTFGLGWKYFESARASHRNTVHTSRQVKVNPSPNHYNLDPQKSYSHNKIKIHQKLAMFTTLNGKYRLNQPDPQTYEINESLVKPSVRKTSQGFSNKVDFTKLTELTPGPIYSTSSFCDKFTRLKIKNSQ